MKNKLSFWMLLVLLSVFTVLLSGCYTQIGSTREEQRDDDYSSSDERRDDQEVYEEDDDAEEDGSYTYNDDSEYRTRVGFSYYYPSTYWPSHAFSVAYANPWSYYSYRSYDPWCYGYDYYNPWYCGTPYVSYNPYWGYYNPYYYPYYSYGSYYSYPYNGKPVMRGGRDNIGNTRGDGERTTVNGGSRNPAIDRTDIGNQSIPTGSRLGTSTGGSARAKKDVPTVGGSRKDGSTRSSVSRSNSGSRKTDPKARGTSSRVYRQRGTTPEKRTSDNGSSAPPTYAPPTKDTGTRDGGSSRGTTPTVAPQPKQSSPPPSPPSNRGGSAPSNSGTSRGGSTRGGRP